MRLIGQTEISLLIEFFVRLSVNPLPHLVIIIRTPSVLVN